MEENKPKVWSNDQHVAYDVAVNTLYTLEAILTRQSRVIDDKELIDAYDKRALELHREKRLIDGFNEALVDDVIKTYSALIREYDSMKGSAKDRAEKGLSKKFITTKVDYAKYGK